MSPKVLMALYFLEEALSREVNPKLEKEHPNIHWSEEDVSNQQI